MTAESGSDGGERHVCTVGSIMNRCGVMSLRMAVPRRHQDETLTRVSTITRRGRRRKISRGRGDAREHGQTAGAAAAVCRRDPKVASCRIGLGQRALIVRLRGVSDGCALVKFAGGGRDGAGRVESVLP